MENSTKDLQTTKDGNINQSSVVKLENSTKELQTIKDVNINKPSVVSLENTTNVLQTAKDMNMSQPTVVNLENNTKELQTIKDVNINEPSVVSLENNTNYGIGILFILLIVLFIIWKRKKKFIPISTKEVYHKQRENLLDYYIENKNWNMIEELLKDSSCNTETHNRAKKALKDVGKLLN